MPDLLKSKKSPSFVVLRETRPGTWKFLAEVRRKHGLAAQAARTQAIFDATGGKAKAGQVYAAVLSSEWRVGLKWNAPGT